MKKLFFLILVLAFSNLALAQLNESFEGDWLPFDWIIIDNDGGRAITDTFLTIPAHTGTHGASVFACQDDYLVTPKLSPTVGDNTFGYWVRCEDSYYSFSFEIMVSTTGTAVADFVQIADYPDFITATWLNQTEDLSAYNGQEIYIAIHIYSTPHIYHDFGFDDITGPAVFVPSCQHTSAQNETNISTVSADLGWTENATATAWQIEWGPTGFTQGNGTVINVTSNPYTLNGLTTLTTYDWYVRANCGSGDFSTWETSTFTTALAAPFNEPFTNTTIPDAWSMYGLDEWDPDEWDFSTNATYGAAVAGDHTPGGGTQYAYVDGSNGQDNGLTLETPLIDPGNLTAPEFSFWYFSNNTNTPGDNNMLYCEMSIDGGSWVNIFTYSGNYPGWDIFTHDLSSYTISGSVKFRFIVDMNISHTFYNDILIDDVVVGEAPLCPDPSAQTATNIISNSANLVWSENGTATLWQIEWGPNGFVQGTGTVVTVNSNPYNLAGLSATTSYDWYVQADCGGGVYGTWMGPCTFTTPCVSVNVFPWIEDFDASTATPDCWTNIGSPNTTQVWEIDDFLAIMGAFHDHTTNWSNFARVDDGYPSSRPTNLDTPPLDVTALTTPILSFWYWLGRGATGSMLYIDVFDGTSWTEGVDTIGPHNGWIKDTVNISAYSSVATQIRFRGMEHMYDDNCDICIDDISVDEIASCAAPTELTSTNITSNAESLSWTENGTANTWDIEYGPTGFSRGSGTVVSGITANPYTLTGLSTGTTYDWYVRADCGGGDVSLWDMPDIFTTTCGMVSLPIIQGFNSPYIKDCWTETLVYTPYPWSTPELYYRYYTAFPWCTPYEGGYMVKFDCDYSAADGTEIRLESPQFSTSGMTAARVMFAWHEYLYDPDPYEGVTVQWSLDGVNWNNGDFYPRAVGSESGWSYKIYNLPAGAIGQSSVYIGFLFHSSGEYNCYLDDVTIEETPSCLYPWSQITTSVATTSAKLGWDEAGSATTWEVEWGQTGFAQGSGNTVTGITNNPYFLNGLTANNTYDWYVRADCGAGDYSLWIGPQTFTSVCAPNTSYPWEEDFEWDFIPGCWSKIVSPGNDITQSTAQNHTASGSSSARFSSSSNSSDYNQYLFTGQHLIDYNYGQLTFWHRKESTDVELLEWGVATTTDPNDYTWTAVPLSNTEWQETSVYIGNYSYQTVYIGFRYYGDNSEHVYLDDINIDAVATCPEPSCQEVLSSTYNSATLNWLSSGGAVVWEIEWGYTGFVPGSGFIISTSDNPHQLTNIPSFKTLDWYIRSDCGGGLYSYQVGPNTFNTPCYPQSIPYSQNFDNSNEWPYGWFDDGDIWNVAEIDGNSGYSVLADYNNNGSGSLYAPTFNGTSKTDLHVRFFTHWEAWYPNWWQEGYFYGSTDGGATKILLEHWFHLNPSIDVGWKQYDISSWADGAPTITFWWKLSMSGDRFWIIDDFAIQEGSFGTNGLWTGVTDNDWNTASNWDDGLVPQEYTDVTINTGLANYPTIVDPGAECDSVILKSNISGNASLIDNGNLTVNASAKVERYIPQYTGAIGWHYLSSPVMAQAIQPEFVADPPSSSDDFYKFSEPGYLWFNVKDNSGNWNSSFEDDFVVGRGYNVAYAENETKTFSGELNVGDFTFDGTTTPAITYTAGGGIGWNLVGNPYPSALDWDLCTKSNIDGAVYAYDGDAGQYVSWNGSIGGLANGIIPPMNGFFIKASASPELTIPNSARVHTATNFYKEKEYVKDLLVLKVEGNGFSDKTFIHFNVDASNAFDSDFDAYKLSGIAEAPQLYTKAEDSKLSINVLPYSSDEIVIPLSLKVSNDGEYKISVSENTFWETVDFSLKDLETGNIYDIRTINSLTISHSPNNSPDRFLLLINGATGIEETTPDNGIEIYCYGDQIFIKTDELGEVQVAVYNMLGQNVASRNLTGFGNLSGLNPGFYLVVVKTDDAMKVKKVFVR